MIFAMYHRILCQLQQAGSHYVRQHEYRFKKKLHPASLKIRLPLKNKQHRKMFRRRWTVKEKLRLIRETEGSSYNLHQIWLAEDALSILRPNQVQREVWVKSNLPLVLHADHVAGTAATTSNITTSPTDNIDANNGNNYSSIPQTAIFLDNPMHIPSIISHVIDTGAIDEADNTMAAAATASNFDHANITKFLVCVIVDRLVVLWVMRYGTISEK